MLISVIGYEDVSYFSKKSNKQVSGTKFYFTYPDKKTNGLRTDNVFLSSEFVDCRSFTLPAEADLYYNKYGYVDCLTFR